MIDTVVKDITHVSGSALRPKSLLIQLTTEPEKDKTQGEENEEDEEIEEIPNPKNVDTREETSDVRSISAEEVDMTTIIFTNDSQLLYYFLPVMPWMKAMLTGNLSYVSWTYQNFPNVKVLSQNFPRVINFGRSTIAYNNESTSTPLGIYNKVTYISSDLMNKAGVRLALEKE